MTFRSLSLIYLLFTEYLFAFKFLKFQSVNFIFKVPITGTTIAFLPDVVETTHSKSGGNYG